MSQRRLQEKMIWKHSNSTQPSVRQANLRVNKNIERNLYAEAFGFNFKFSFPRISNEEPVIPEKYLKNLSSPHTPVSGKYRFLLSPTKVLNYLRKKQNRCYITLMVYGVGSIQRRFLIRMSWATIKEIDGKGICVFFVLASNINHGLDFLLSKENDLYGDILQSSLLMSSANSSSLKILSAFQWALENIGSRSDYYIIIQGEIFPDLPNIFEYCLAMDKSDKKNIFHCGMHLNQAQERPRDLTAHNYVSVKEYPSALYPAYCDSKMVIQSNEQARNLYETARFTYIGQIPDEGLFVWGILREKMRGRGRENLISVEKFLQGKDILPLARKVDISSQHGQQEIQNKFNQTLDKLIFDDSDGRLKQGISTLSRRKAVRDKLPTNSPNKTPELDMKLFVSQWKALSQLSF